MSNGTPSSGPSLMGTLSPLGQFGAALAGLGAGMQGQPNPLLAQQNLQFQQQAELIRLQQAAERGRLERHRMELGLYQDLLKSESSAARSVGAKGVAAYLGNTPPGFAESLSAQRYSLQDIEKIQDAKLRGIPVETVVAATPRIPPDTVRSLYAQEISDTVRKGLKWPTAADLAVERRKADLDSLMLLRARYGLSGDSPRAQAALQQAWTRYGKGFEELGSSQRQELLKATEGLMAPPKTTLVRNALAAEGLPETTQDPRIIQGAITRYLAKQQQDRLNAQAQIGQLSQIGANFRQENTKVMATLDRLVNLDQLADDASRLIEEGRRLGVTTNPKLLNWAMQEVAVALAKPGTKLSQAAQWVAAFQVIDARYASVAQALEQITANRLALTLAQKAMGYHPRVADNYEVQLRKLKELRYATARARHSVTEDLARVTNQYEAASRAAGVPFVLSAPQPGWKAEEERE